MMNGYEQVSSSYSTADEDINMKMAEKRKLSDDVNKTISATRQKKLTLPKKFEVTVPQLTGTKIDNANTIEFYAKNNLNLSFTAILKPYNNISYYPFAALLYNNGMRGLIFDKCCQIIVIYYERWLELIPRIDMTQNELHVINQSVYQLVKFMLSSEKINSENMYFNLPNTVIKDKNVHNVVMLNQLYLMSLYRLRLAT
ncbi:PxORF113 peptide [Plutella xylostella granulovirus]|uniref:PxGV-Torf111 protein n=2 Tax=Plutella xylostella granulovirus TaxID=98383 RepID=Q9DVS0_9BBAC|nr:PxORF113 peptide [Plutella xylostella granulovirus]AAG27411.1 PxORF113 peptide [Plutella xylostella granulovirus]AMQ36074.1 PxGV-Torf111 protein [Plutella xylostella granulovirus]